MNAPSHGCLEFSDFQRPTKSMPSIAVIFCKRCEICINEHNKSMAVTRCPSFDLSIYLERF